MLPNLSGLWLGKPPRCRACGPAAVGETFPTFADALKAVPQSLVKRSDWDKSVWSGQKAPECPICLEPLHQRARDDESASEAVEALFENLECGHCFHRECLLGHLQSDDAYSLRCPLCRLPIDQEVLNVAFGPGAPQQVPIDDGFHQQQQDSDVLQVVAESDDDDDYYDEERLRLGYRLETILELDPTGATPHPLYGHISDWDVSAVTDMSGLFNEATLFNQDLSRWDVGNVEDMHNMFFNARSFASDLSGWDVGKVTHVYGMFARASSFTSDLSRWDVGSVVNMSYMFYEAGSFTSDLSRWNVGNVIDMSHMFYNARSFTSDLSRWNVGNVRDMSYMFLDTPSFNLANAPWLPAQEAAYIDR